ncbi:MAG: sulfide/dihydroorotate dehydrogenase-like FAD/NAD-binding protein [Christensenellales bacterium]
MYPIVSKRRLAPNLVEMWIKAPRIVRKTRPGQFIILRTDEEGERVPLTVADTDKDQGTLMIVFQEVGLSTRQMGVLEAGDSLRDVVGPLGKASDLPTSGKVLCVGGGVGTAVVYPQVKWMHQQGVEVDVIVGARSKEYIILEEEIRSGSANLYITTDDGSRGMHGNVTDMMKKLYSEGNRYDEVIAIGPLIMMKFVCALTREWGVKTMISMNPVMVDGTGMCGGCRLTVGGKTVYACVDGPDFDGHLVDFEESMRRQGMYRDEEDHLCRRLAQ